MESKGFKLSRAKKEHPECKFCNLMHEIEWK